MVGLDNERFEVFNKMTDIFVVIKSNLSFPRLHIWYQIGATSIGNKIVVFGNESEVQIYDTDKDGCYVEPYAKGMSFANCVKVTQMKFKLFLYK